MANLRIVPKNYFDLATLTESPAMLDGSSILNSQLVARDKVAQSAGLNTQTITGHFGGNGYLVDSLFLFRHTGHGGKLRFNVYNHQNCTHGNLFTKSEDFTHADWAKFNAQITAQSVTAPDGVTPMRKLIDDTNNTEHILYRASQAVTSGLAYFDAIYAQQGERTRVRIRIDDVATNTNFAEGLFNLTTGVATVAGTGGASPPTAVSAVMTGIANPDGTTTYRCELRFTPAQTANYRCLHKLDNGTSSTYVGNGTGLYLWAAMFGKGATATPYGMTDVTADPDDGTFALYDSGWLEIYQLVSLGNMEWMGNAPAGFSTTDMLASESAFSLFFPATGATGFRLTFTRCQYHYWQFGRIYLGKYVEAPYNPRLGMEYGWMSNTEQTRTKGATLRTRAGGRWREVTVDMFYLTEAQRPVWRDLAAQMDLSNDIALSVFPGYGGRQERDFVFNAQMVQHNPFGWNNLTLNETKYQFTEL